MNTCATIKLEKNRGWRGLAQATIYDSEGAKFTSMMFSFSPAVWKDMLEGYMVILYEDFYYILQFDNLASLPRKDQQRSVLIKNFTGNIISAEKIPRNLDGASSEQTVLIAHFSNNKNNHTISDWNYIGVRVNYDLD